MTNFYKDSFYKPETLLVSNVSLFFGDSRIYENDQTIGLARLTSQRRLVDGLAREKCSIKPGDLVVVIDVEYETVPFNRNKNDEITVSLLFHDKIVKLYYVNCIVINNKKYEDKNFEFAWNTIINDYFSLVNE